MKIVGICGKMGVGKNFLADVLMERYYLNKSLSGWSASSIVQLAFADQLKIDCVVRDKVGYERVFGRKDNEIRSLLQRRGTEEGRDKYGEGIWIEYMRNWIRMHNERGVEVFIVTDVRFHNEAEFIREMGGVLVNVVAEKRNLERVLFEAGGDLEKARVLVGHRSETDLDGRGVKYDYVFENDVGSGMSVENFLEMFVRLEGWGL